MTEHHSCRINLSLNSLTFWDVLFFSGSDSDELNWKPTEAAGKDSNGSQESNFDSLLGSPNSNQSSPEKAKPKAKPVAAEKPKPKPAAKPNKEAWESSGDEDNIIDEDTDEDEEFSLVTFL